MVKLTIKLLYLLVFKLMFSCAKREDKFFAASSDMYYLHLYQNDKQFEILYNGVNIQTGTYMIKGDTVLLTYSFNEELPDANKVLPRTLLINDSTKSIRSIDGTAFDADIYIDNRKN